MPGIKGLIKIGKILIKRGKKPTPVKRKEAPGEGKTAEKLTFTPEQKKIFKAAPRGPVSKGNFGSVISVPDLKRLKR